VPKQINENYIMNKFAPVMMGMICLTISGIGLAQSAPKPETSASPLPVMGKALRGHWTLKVAFEPASGLPAGTEGQGEETWREVVGGKTLLSEESWKAGPIDLSLLGIFWWDGKENRLHAMDCNNQGKSICDPKDAVDAVVVKWNGKELTIEEPERGTDGKLITSRVTFKDIQANSFTELNSLEMSPGKFEPVMTIHAVRAGT
jgi:hypothetical protein